MQVALAQAKEARFHILGQMEAGVDRRPRRTLRLRAASVCREDQPGEDP